MKRDFNPVDVELSIENPSIERDAFYRLCFITESNIAPRTLKVTRLQDLLDNGYSRLDLAYNFCVGVFSQQGIDTVYIRARRSYESYVEAYNSDDNSMYYFVVLQTKDFTEVEKFNSHLVSSDEMKLQFFSQNVGSKILQSPKLVNYHQDYTPSDAVSVDDKDYYLNKAYGGDEEPVEPPWSPELVLPVKLKAETDSYGELPVVINFEGGSAQVDFGDGSEVLEYTDSVEHTYPASPVEGELVPYSISVTPTSRIPLLSTDIRELTDWGSAGSVNRFRFLHMSPSVPASLPSWIKDTSYMFYGCRGFSSDISGWDVSNVTNMEYMLFQCSSLNSDLGGWDVSKVTNMKYTFSECHGNLGTFENWDVSSVTDMSHMFDSALIATYANLSQWDVCNVTDMSYLLACIVSSHNFNSDLSEWNTSNVTNMSHMFSGCNYLFDKYSSVGNWSLEKWDVSKVTDMERMFYQCYNGVSSNISRWKTGNVTNMKELFAGCQNMNHLTFWDTSKVTTMEGMFEDAYQFNSDISNWDVSNVVNMDNMFKGVQWLIVSLDKWCVEKISEEPTGFAPDANYMPDENKPVWGTCPSGDG